MPEELPESNKTVKIQCPACGGGPRNHRVLREYQHSEDNEDVGWHGGSLLQICQCQGCDSFRFRRESWDSDEVDDDGQLLASVRTYPEASKQRNPHTAELLALPGVGPIYRETIAAFNADAHILTGGGLRAIVEAICKDQQIKGTNLQKKIDGLVAKGLLAKPQADLLHEERFIGNAALHELEAPAVGDLVLGIEIAETLLRTIYVLPKKVERLRNAAAAKNRNTDGHESQRTPGNGAQNE